MSNITQTLVVIGYLYLASVYTACGDDRNTADTSSPTLSLRFLEADGEPYLPAAEQEDATPTTLLLTLSGPEGSRTESVDYASRKLALPRLSEGKWSISGDGLDAQGAPQWRAAKTTFTVVAGKQTQIKLDFVALESQSK